MEYVLLFFVMCMAEAKAVLNRKLKNGSNTVYQTLRMNMICFAVAFLTIFLLGLKDIKTLF